MGNIWQGNVSSKAIYESFSYKHCSTHIPRIILSFAIKLFFWLCDSYLICLNYNIWTLPCFLESCSWFLDSPNYTSFFVLFAHVPILVICTESLSSLELGSKTLWDCIQTLSGSCFSYTTKMLSLRCWRKGRKTCSSNSIYKDTFLAKGRKLLGPGH